MKKFTTLIFFSICMLYGCSKEDDPIIPVVTEICFDDTPTTIQLGGYTTLNVDHTPSDLTAPTYSWSSSDDSIIKVTQSGFISAEELGTAVISVITESGLTASCTITVIPIEATELTLSENELTLDFGETHELTCQIFPYNTTDKTIIWSSSDESVATVKDGFITTISNGTCDIIATINGSTTDICKLTVIRIPITAISITPEVATIDIGSYIQFEYSLQPTDATDYGLIWTSSDESVATIDSGMCLGIKEGTTNITLETADGVIQATTELIVKDLYPYCEVGKSYTSQYGFSVVVNSITTSNDDYTQKTTCSINYTITNITSDKVLSEITFKCKTQSGDYESQYGFFNSIYPNGSQTRSYTFSSLISNPFTRLEISPIWNDIIDPEQSELIWKVE